MKTFSIGEPVIMRYDGETFTGTVRGEIEPGAILPVTLEDGSKEYVDLMMVDVYYIEDDQELKYNHYEW